MKQGMSDRSNWKLSKPPRKNQDFECVCINKPIKNLSKEYFDLSVFAKPMNSH